MRKPSPTFYAIVATVFVGACCDHPKDSGSVEVMLIPQETDKWCWAASAQMILATFGTEVEQCEEANSLLVQTDCCVRPTSLRCNQGGFPQFEKYGYKPSVREDAALSWDEVKTQISTLKQAFVFTWRFAGDAGHMMVANGYETVDGEHYVCITDPSPPAVGDQELVGDHSCTTYDEYVSNSWHTHWNDYYNFQKLE